MCVGPPPQITDKLLLKVTSGPTIKFVHTSETAHYWTLDTWYDLRVNQLLLWKQCLRHQEERELQIFLFSP